MRTNPKQLTRTTDATVEPVSIAEIKTILKEDSSDLDSILTALITPARQLIEKYLNRSLITQTWNFKFSCLESRNIFLFYAPVQAIVSLKTFDSSNTEAVYNADNYSLIDDRLVIDDLASLPVNLRHNYAYEIIYNAGYGDAASDVPEAIRQAVIYQVIAFHEGNCCETELDRHAKILSSPYRVY